MKLVMSDKAVLPACMFSGWYYKWKSVVFQLKEQKQMREVFKPFSLFLKKHHWIHFAFLLHSGFSAHHIGLFYFISSLCWCYYLRFFIIKSTLTLSLPVCCYLWFPEFKDPPQSTFFIHFTFFHYSADRNISAFYKVHMQLNTPHHLHGRKRGCKRVLALFLLP